jgi:transposase-like protein
MEEKLRFVFDYERDEHSMVDLCSRYGICRDTGYEWLRRFRMHGVKGLAELNRAARQHPNQASAEVERAVLDLRAAGSARRGAYLGSDDRSRTGQHLLSLRECAEADGLLRSISERRLQWQTHSKKRHYQVRQRAPETHRGGIGLELSTPAPREGKAAQATPRSSGGDHRNCMEGAEPPAQALHEVDHGRQGSEEDHDGSRTRTAGLHLGHRNQGRSGGLQATNGGITGTERTKAKTFQIRKKQRQTNR